MSSSPIDSLSDTLSFFANEVRFRKGRETALRCHSFNVLKTRVGLLLTLSFALLFVLGCPAEKKVSPPTGPRYVHDPNMKETLVDLFPGMDGPNLNLTADDIRGRNVWNLWTGDSYRMWDFLAQEWVRDVGPAEDDRFARPR